MPLGKCHEREASRKKVTNRAERRHDEDGWERERKWAGKKW
jgi:hypothetical protein